MNKFFCDRCNDEIYGQRNILKLSGGTVHSIPHKDICNPCAKKLQDFLKNE